jgi:AcrR family transcriptional regulator
MSRPRLNRQRVIRAAVKLADREGIEAVTMRRLGRELGVEAMSLYNHVANKDEILEGIADAVVGEIDRPRKGTDWKTALRSNAIATRDMYLRHRWASGLKMRRMPGPATLSQNEWILKTLREAGFSDELTFHAYHILESYVLGFTVQELNFTSFTKEQMAEMAATFLRDFPRDEYPHFTEHVEQHLDPPPGEEGGFELGLNLLLDALERLRDTGDAS